MDSLSALQSFGLTLPSPAYLFGALIFGCVGIGAFRYGRRAGRPRTKWLGVALMLYPYVTAQTWLLYAVGALLSAALLIDRG